MIPPHYRAHVLGALEVGGAISVTHTDETVTWDTCADWPSDADVSAEVSRLTCRAVAVKTFDAGDHPRCLETIYTITEVA